MLKSRSAALSIFAFSRIIKFNSHIVSISNCCKTIFTFNIKFHITGAQGFSSVDPELPPKRNLTRDSSSILSNISFIRSNITFVYSNVTCIFINCSFIVGNFCLLSAIASAFYQFYLYWLRCQLY